MSSGRRAFTLIELLVVIAVIALLVGLALPALSRAREAGRATICLSNQRQIGIALSMYASTYKEWIPRESGSSETGRPVAPMHPGSGYNLAWAFSLRPFLDPLAQWTTPDGGVRDQYANAKYYRDPSRPKDPHNIHYVNNGLTFRYRGPTTPPLCLSQGKPPSPLHRYTRPASAILYLTCFTDDPGGARFGAWYGSNTEATIAIYYDMWNEGNVNRGSSSDPTTSQRTSPERHTKGSNCLWFDGHAATVARQYVLTVTNWDDGDYVR
jgi:prepilin-type N-terminal cleavage/methylation domain-containing protein/prepilin-type processing-associated H-X9-DG protein